jgi:hypothetical protein
MYGCGLSVIGCPLSALVEYGPDQFSAHPLTKTGTLYFTVFYCFRKGGANADTSRCPLGEQRRSEGDNRHHAHAIAVCHYEDGDCVKGSGPGCLEREPARRQWRDRLPNAGQRCRGRHGGYKVDCNGGCG